MFCIDTINQQRKDNLAKYLNTVFPNVLSIMIASYDYYVYDDAKIFGIMIYRYCDNNDYLQTINPSELDIDQLFFVRRLKFNKNYIRKQIQKYTKIREDPFLKQDPTLIVVTKPIKITHGGIPRYDSFQSDVIKCDGPDDIKRAWFYIPKNDDSKELFDMVKKIDDYMHNEINIKKNVNNIKNLHSDEKICFKGAKYHRMITSHKNDYCDDYRDNDAWDRIKVKFSPTPGKFKELVTSLFIGNRSDPEPCVTLSEFEKYFTRRSTVKFALDFSQLWISKCSKLCGIDIKCLQLCITKDKYDEYL